MAFKPQKILDFVIKGCGPEWSLDKLEEIQVKLKQGNLFDEQNLAEFQPVRRLPYKFSYNFSTTQGGRCALMIESWEIGALYWNCVRWRYLPANVGEMRNEHEQISLRD